MTDRIAGIAGVALAVAILYGMQRTTPLYSDITSPVPVAGRQGERVETGDFAIGIANVHLARRLATEDLRGQRSHTTSGVWVIVEGAAETKQESLSLTAAEWLGPDGVRYALTRRLATMPGLLGTVRLEPGIPRPVLMVFEVPESQLSGATLLVSPSALTPLQEEAWIEMADLRPENIRPSATLGRGGNLMPWSLEVE